MKIIFKISILILLFSSLISCLKSENCIIDITNIRRSTDAPGPDLLTFRITSSQKDFEEHIKDYGLVEVTFNENKFLTTPLWGITKIKPNTYELKVATPYFSLIDHYTNEQIYSLFNDSDQIRIKIIFRDESNFTFAKC